MTVKTPCSRCGAPTDWVLKFVTPKTPVCASCVNCMALVMTDDYCETLEEYRRKDEERCRQNRLRN
jgi:hypothetical protein